MKCRCGCGRDASWVVHSFDYDPSAPGKKGEAFAEHACESATRYMRDSAAELGFPCRVELAPPLNEP